MDNTYFIDKMKQYPGLYLVNNTLLVASIGSKLYGMIADNELRDEGWLGTILETKRLFDGRIGKVSYTST